MITAKQVKKPQDNYTTEDVIKLLCEPTATLHGRNVPDTEQHWSPFNEAFTLASIK